MKLSTLFLVLIFFSFSCGQSQQNNNIPSEIPMSDSIGIDTQSKVSAPQTQDIDTITNLKIFVDKSGNITTDGQAVSLTELEGILKKLKSKNGIVYYSRDNIAGDPPQQSMHVMELVTKYELPIIFFTDKTFTQPVKM